MLRSVPPGFVSLLTTLLALVGVLASACGSRDGEPGEIVFAAGQDPSGATERLIERFNREHPQWHARFQAMPASSDLQHDAYVTYLGAGESRIDLYALDVVWTAEFAGAGWLAPLDDAQQGADGGGTPFDGDDFLAAPLRSATHEGVLVAIPWFADAGALFYRRDLLEKHGIAPPETWEELEHAVRVVRAGGEGRASGAGAAGVTADLVGYAWQGARYEGLVCNFLEIFWGRGGSLAPNDLATHPREVERAIAETLRFMSRLLTEDGGATPLSPAGVLTWREEDGRLLFTGGGALFLRNWPYVWSLAQAENSSVAGRVGIAPLPHAAGEESASVLGGWNVALSRFSHQPEGARELLRFLTSAEAMKERALAGGYLPARRSVFEDPEVKRTYPHFARLRDLVNTARNRPPSSNYARLSDLLQRHIHEALTGETEPEKAARALVQELPAFIGAGAHLREVDPAAAGAPVTGGR